MSKVQICNRGLSTYLGQATITSFDDSSPAAEQCTLHYDDTVETIFEAHWWHFATGRQVLAELVNDRPCEWLFKYARPAEAAIIRWVNKPTSARVLIEMGEDPAAPIELVADVIYSNVQFASCEYTKIITDTSKYPRHFANAISAQMAAVMAMPLTEDLKRARNAADQADMLLDKAMVIDEQQTPPIKFQTTPAYLKARGIS